MRKGLLIGVLALYAAWFIWKPIPLLTRDQPAIWSTPTLQPTDPTLLAPVRVPGGGRACMSNIEFGPKARYAMVTLLPGKWPTRTIRVEARAPGYRADARIAPGLVDNQLAIVALRPARSSVVGTLCFINTGRHRIAFYGFGADTSPSVTTVDGKALPQELSLTLLESPSKPLIERVGDVIGHVAAFRPVTSWEIWIVLLALLFATPVALAVALSRAAALDDEAPGYGDDDAPSP
jgi:hypothetical protein